MTKLILVRHPQTTWNEKGKLQGWREGRITPKGKFQASNYLKNFQHAVTQIFCADNQRTKFLAKQLSQKLNLPFSVTPLLREKGFGIYEGKKSYKIARLVKWQNLSLDQKYTRIPKNGESMQQTGDRAKKLLNNICKNISEQETVVLVTSGALIRSLLVELKLINKIYIYALKIANCSETILEFKSNTFSLKNTSAIQNNIERVI